MSALSTLRRRPRDAQQRTDRAGGAQFTPLSYLGVVLLGLFAVLPIVVLVFNSLKSPIELGLDPVGPPESLRWENYGEAWVQGGFAQGLLNSAIVVAGTIVGTWVVAGAASYALARLDLPFKRATRNYLYLVISLPVQLFLVPLFFLWTNLGLIDTLPGLIIIFIALNTPFAVLLLQTFLVAIPREIDEAARLDGANEFQVATRVVLPLATPGFLTVGLVVGLAAYNELLFTVTFMSSTEKLPISVSFLQFSQGNSASYGLVDAGGIILAVPVVVLFLLMQRRFINGLTSGGTKG